MVYRTPHNLAPAHPCNFISHHPPFTHSALALSTAIPGTHLEYSHLEDFVLSVHATRNAIFPDVSMAYFLTSFRSLSNVTTFSERSFLTTLSETAPFIALCVLLLFYFLLCTYHNLALCVCLLSPPTKIREGALSIFVHDIYPAPSSMQHRVDT